MSAIDEMRQLACDINEEEIRSHSVITLNQGRYNRQFRLDVNHDWLNAWHAEFERILQAIAATLGDADLAAENAKLREDLEFERSENGWVREFLNRMGQKCGTEDCPSLVAYVTKLESENAKLQELVKRMHGHIKENCDTCDGWYCSSFDEDNECCVYDTLAREVGVEVE